jgi:hypothetical protein
MVLVFHDIIGVDPPTASEEESNTTKTCPLNQHRQTGLEPEDSKEEKAAAEELERERAKQEAADQEAAKAEAEARRREHDEYLKSLNSLGEELKKDTAPFTNSTDKKKPSTGKKSAFKKKCNAKTKAKATTGKPPRAPSATQNVSDDDFSLEDVDLSMSDDNGDEDIGDVDMNQEHSTNKVPGGQHKLRKLDDHLDSSSSVNK